jgi:hypothetical protein
VAGDDFYRVMDEDERAALSPAEGAARYYDWERLRDEALVPLRNRRSAMFCPYAWEANDLAGKVITVAPAPLVIVDFGWPGVDPAADPSFEDAVAAWRDRSGQLRDHLEAAAVTAEVEVLENGANAVHDCVGVVFEEHFHHLRYALRDLDRLG